MGLAEVRAKRNFRTVFKQVFDGGKRALNSVFVGNLAVLHGYVEVAPHEHFFAFELFEVFYRHFVHKNGLLNQYIFSDYYYKVLPEESQPQRAQIMFVNSSFAIFLQNFMRRILRDGKRFFYNIVNLFEQTRFIWYNTLKNYGK